MVPSHELERENYTLWEKRKFISPWLVKPEFSTESFWKKPVFWWAGGNGKESRAAYKTNGKCHFALVALACWYLLWFCILSLAIYKAGLIFHYLTWAYGYTNIWCYKPVVPHLYCAPYRMGWRNLVPSSILNTLNYFDKLF